VLPFPFDVSYDLLFHDPEAYPDVVAPEIDAIAGLD
jgi:hypothetical protein